jgi:16S rRNA processing protein RimM
MDLSECFEFGFISKPHGLKGDVTAQIVHEPNKPLNKIEIIFVLQRGQLVPFFVTAVSVNNGQAIIKFEEIDTQAKAFDLKGCKLFLPDKFKPKASGNDFLISELIGFDIEDKTLGPLGSVFEVYDIPNNPLLGILYQTKEALIPINDTFILGFDKKTKVLKVDLPEGLLDVYLSNSHTQDDGD